MAGRAGWPKYVCCAVIATGATRMPEATYFCVDCSDYMRNGDFFPNRMMAAQDSVNILAGQKMQTNPENTVGLISMGGAECVVRETLTDNTDRVMSSLSHLQPSGKLHFATALQIANLALAHRSMPHASKRIVVFVASPITEPPAVLEKIAKKLKKEDVAVDIVAFGVPANVDLLKKFVEAVDKSGSSHFIDVPTDRALADVILTSVLVNGDGAAASGGPAGPVSAVDPSADPELAYVLQLSLADHQQQMAAAAAAAAASQAAPAVTAEVPVDEDAELQRAIALSREEENGGVPVAEGAAAATSAPTDNQPTGAIAASAFEAFADANFVADLEREIGGQDAAGTQEKKDGKNQPPPPPPS